MTAQAQALSALRSAGSDPIVRCFPQGAIITFDRDLRYLSAGGMGLADVGLSREMLEGKTIFEAFPPEVTAIIEPHYRMALAGCESKLDVPYEGRIYLQRLAPLRDADGQIIAGMGFTQDVTAARESELALNESEARFRSAFENAPIGKALITVDGRYEQVNQAMCDITRYSRAELLEMNMADATEPEDLAADQAGMACLLAGDVSTYSVHKRYRTGTGEVVWAAKTASLVRSADGSPRHFIAQVQDITQLKEQDKLLAEERRRLRDAQVIGHVGSWEWDIDADAMHWSDTMFDLYGRDRHLFGGDYQAALLCVDPEDRDEVDAAVVACRTTGGAFFVRYRVTRQNDGALRWFDARGEAMHRDGRIICIGGAVADVTEHIMAEAEARSALAFQQAVMSTSPDIIFVYDIATRATVWTNRSLPEMLGYGSDAVEAMAGKDFIDCVVVDDDRASFDVALQAEAAAADGDICQVAHRLRHADGSARWFSRRTTPLERDEEGCVTQLVGALRDVTDATIVEERLEHAALHDDLTGLPNRRLISDRLRQALNRSEREGEVAVLYCDLDGFKRINDAYGHHAGDAVLIESAARMIAATRSGDTVGRMGGDEFVVICGVPRGQDSSVLANTVARRIEKAMSQPVLFEDAAHRVTVSSGICVAGQGDDADTVLRNADVAMYLAKSHGKNGHVMFEAALHTDVLERVETERNIRAALTAGTVEAYYQPVVDPTTGRLCALEALLRVPNGTGQLLNTYQVVTVAEQAGLITQLDDCVLRLACAQTALWREQPGHADLTIHVNRSAADIGRPGFYDRITEVLTSTGLDARALILEITETVLLDASAHAITDVRRLRADGIGIAIDDFGTGYASLRYLATLPITCIKVDRSFTAGLPGDPISSTILRASVNLAADLGMDCVIEGVETTEQRHALPRSPNLLVQGYLFARPAPPEATLPMFVTPPPAVPSSSESS